MNRYVRLLGVASGIRLLGIAMIYPFLSLYFRNVAGLGYALIGALIVLVSLPPLAVSPFGGFITDRLGRRNVFLAGLGGEAASVTLLAYSMWSGSVPGVLLCAALAGVAGATAQPAVQAYVADMTDLAERSMAYTWVRIGFNVGFTGGVVLGGALIGFLGFSDTAFLTAAIMVSGVAFMVFTLQASPYDLALKKGGTAVGLSSAPPRPGSIANSARLLAKDKPFLALCLSMLLAGLIYGHWSTTYILFSNSVLGVPYLVLSFALGMNGLIVIFGQIPTTRLLTGRRHTYAGMLAVTLMGASFLVLGGVSLVQGASLVAVFGFAFILTIGENVGSIPSMTLASNVAPPSEIGNYNGVFGMFNGIGNSLAPLLGGVALALFSNSLVVWTILAIPCIPAILLFRWVGARIPEKANTI